MSESPDIRKILAEKLEFLRAEQAKAIDGEHKFALKKRIEEVEQALAGLPTGRDTAAAEAKDEASGPGGGTDTGADDETLRLLEELDELYQRREDLTLAGKGVRAVNAKIRELKERHRRGPQLRPGELLDDGRYRLAEQLGKGGFATVWKAFDRRRQGLVAIKVLHGQHAEDRTSRDRFFRGARQMASLGHPNVVQVLEPEVEDGGWHFFVMELVDGPNFEQAVLQGLLTTEQKIDIVIQVGEALETAHRRGIVHRDVKPSNILLDEKLRPKLTDFDLVRAEDTAGLTKTQAMMGTLQFAAPEALMSAKDAGPAVDVYSLASTAVLALSGKPLPPDYYRSPQNTIRTLGVPKRFIVLLIRSTRSDKRRWPKTAGRFVQELQQLTSTKDAFLERSRSPMMIYIVASAILILSLFVLYRQFPFNKSAILSHPTPASGERLGLGEEDLSSRVIRKTAALGDAVLSEVGAPVKIITTRETLLYRQANFRSDSAPCPAFKFWYVLPPDKDAPRKIEDLGSLTRNGFYRVAASDSELEFKGWISQAAAVEWHYDYAVGFSQKHGRRLVHFFPSEVAALEAMTSGDLHEATHREPEVSGDEMSFMPLLNFKDVEIDGLRINLLETAFMASGLEVSPRASSNGVVVPGVKGEVTPARIIKESTVDIVFVVDTTIGMQPAIERIKRAVEEVDSNLRNSERLLSRLRFGLVAFRDTVPDMQSMEYLTKIFCTLEEGKDHDLFLAVLDQVQEASAPSGDHAEDVLAGLDRAMSLRDMKWNPLGWKQIVVISDSSIKEPNHPDPASRKSERNRTLTGFMERAQSGAGLENIAQGGFVISAVRIRHPDAKDDNSIGDRQFSRLVAGRIYQGRLISVRGGADPEDFSGELAQSIMAQLGSFDEVLLKPGIAPAPTSLPAVAAFPWPVLDTLDTAGEGSAGRMRLHRRYVPEFDADGNRVFTFCVFIQKGQLLAFNAMLDFLQGQVEDAGDPGHRNVATILRNLWTILATLNLAESITADTPIDQFLNPLLGVPIKNLIFHVTIADLAAMSQADYDDWVQGVNAQKDMLKALTENAHIWKKLYQDVNDRAAHAFIPLSDLP